MHDKCERSKMNIYNIRNLDEVGTHSPEIGIGASETFEFDDNTLKTTHSTEVFERSLTYFFWEIIRPSFVETEV